MPRPPGIETASELIGPSQPKWATGYQHSDYARALAQFGDLRNLPNSRGWVLERNIAGFDCRDAMGCYPLFACQNWNRLHLDLDEIGSELVSLALVADPFGVDDEAYLRRCFPDKVCAFKQHFIIDLQQRMDTFVSPHHRRNADRALRQLTTETCVRPRALLDDWDTLYGTLIGRRGLQGISAFSRDSFARQLQVPGITAFRAIRSGLTVGMLLWYVQEPVGYYHLGAFSELGYSLRASFALFTRAIEHFSASGLRFLDLGGGAGVNGNGPDGLTRFKKGWSNAVRTAYFCGRIFDHEKYARIVRAQNIPQTDYFPAYRLGEFQ